MANGKGGRGSSGSTGSVNSGKEAPEIRNGWKGEDGREANDIVPTGKPRNR